MALLLWLQTLSTHEVNGVAVLEFQHNFVPFNPLNLLHYAYVPVYCEHVAVTSIQPLALVTQFV
jgi:hypothetical protein